jgi:hypothetical protein
MGLELVMLRSRRRPTDRLLAFLEHLEPAA